MSLSLAVLFIVMFELGPGPICWIYMSEVMNQNGCAVGTFINWFLTLVVGLLTPYLFDHSSQLGFLIFAVFCALGFLFCLVCVKETKGLTEADLMNLYRPALYKLDPLRDTTTTYSSFLTSQLKSVEGCSFRDQSIKNSSELQD